MTTPDPTAATDGPVDITVVIPSHARPELLRRAVGTASAQERVRFEIVVVDDGSPVPATEALAGISRGHATELRVFRNERSQGVARARNRGIEEAAGTYVAFLDDDDLWSSDKLASQLAAMTSAGTMWSHTGTLWLDAQLGVKWMSLPGSDRSSKAALRHGNFVGTPSSVVVRTDILRETGGFDPAFSILADWDLWLRVADHGDGSAVQQPQIGYVIHPGSMHRQAVGPVIDEYRLLRRKHRTRGPDMWLWIADIARDGGRRKKAIPLYAVIALRWQSRTALRSAYHALRGWNPAPAWAKPAPPTPVWVSRWTAATDPGETPAGAGAEA